MLGDKNLDIYYEKVIGPQSIHSNTIFSKRHHKRFVKYYNMWKSEIDSEGGIAKWGEKHSHKRNYMSFWKRLETVIICGPKIHWDRHRKEWQWSDNIHLYSKMVLGKKMNCYDKLRFKLVTGVKYE